MPIGCNSPFLIPTAYANMPREENGSCANWRHTMKSDANWMQFSFSHPDGVYRYAERGKREVPDWRHTMKSDANWMQFSFSHPDGVYRYDGWKNGKCPIGAVLLEIGCQLDAIFIFSSRRRIPIRWVKKREVPNWRRTFGNRMPIGRNYHFLLPTAYADTPREEKWEVRQLAPISPFSSIRDHSPIRCSNCRSAPIAPGTFREDAVRSAPR